MNIEEKRISAFSSLQTKLNNESPKKIDERIVAIDATYKKYLDVMSWEEKRELILDTEFNYIQQCQEADLDIYLS